jgi:hypothetical protein
MAQTLKVNIPEIFFANMLTSSYYKDSEEKVIGGRNGIGARAVQHRLFNIFSTSFTVATVNTLRVKLSIRSSWIKRATLRRHIHHSWLCKGNISHYGSLWFTFDQFGAVLAQFLSSFRAVWSSVRPFMWDFQARMGTTCHYKPPQPMLSRCDLLNHIAWPL